MKPIIYLDFAATTPVDSRVATKMIECLTIEGNFGNPASRSHMIGWKAEAAVENARKQVAELIGANNREVVWTSGATESDNLALKGIAESYADKGRHIITSAIEHKAVLDSAAYLESQGFEVSYVQPGNDGIVSVESIQALMRDDTILVSIMHVNNELGSVNPIAAIGAMCREKGIVFHVDGAQAAGKIEVDVNAACIDLYSMSAHKLYGPKGVGALYVRRANHLKVACQIHGGGHERGMRSGTLATHQLVGFGEAAEVCRTSLEEDTRHYTELRTLFLNGIGSLSGVSINGSSEHYVPNIVNISFANVDGETLLMALNNIAVSSGSACNSASVDPSFVLTTIGVPRELALASIRFSFGRTTTPGDINAATAKIVDVVTTLRGE